MAKNGWRKAQEEYTACLLSSVPQLFLATFPHPPLAASTAHKQGSRKNWMKDQVVALKELHPNL